MNRPKQYQFLTAALATLFTIAPSLAPADSLVTVDGDSYVGPITKIASGYSVLTTDGPVEVPAEKVKRILYDHPPAAGVTPVPPAAPVAPAPPPVAVAPATSGKKITDSVALKSAIDHGQTALATGQFGDARDAFKEALTLDPKNAIAGRGLGYAYIALGKSDKAIEPLEIAAATPPLDKSLTLAISSSLVADHNAMRAVKYLVPWLESHPTPVDETMVNALGIALSQSDSSAAKGTAFKDAVKLYLKLNSALESTKPGKRRWGTEWMDATDVTAKESARAAALNAADDTANKLQSANSEVTSAQTELTQANNGRRNNGKVREAQKSLNQANDNLAKAQTAYDSAHKALTGLVSPTFPTLIAIENGDLVMPGGLVVASTGALSAKTDSPPIASATPATVDPTQVAPPPNIPAGPVPNTPAPVTPAPVTPVPVTPSPVAPGLAQKPETESTTTPEPAVKPAAPKPEVPKHGTRSAVAFAIAPDVLVTSSAAIADATTITVQTGDGKSATATVLRTHLADGIALLKVDGAKYPCLSLATELKDDTVSCLGFPEVDLFNPIPQSMDVTVGPVTDSWKIHFTGSPRIPGGPLLQNGAVVGVELGDRDSDLAAVPAASLKALADLVEDSARQTTLTTDAKKAVMQITAER